MPEEINRIVTDALADILFVDRAPRPSTTCSEGLPVDAVFFVGNPMIDTLLANLGGRSGCGRRPAGLSGDYAVATLHRPANVDTAAGRRPSSPCCATPPRACQSSYRSPPRGASVARGGGAARDRPPAGRRADRLYGSSRSCGGASSSHRLRRHPGGDDDPRCPVPDRPPNTGADHDRHRHEPPVRPEGVAAAIRAVLDGRPGAA